MSRGGTETLAWAGERASRHDSGACVARVCQSTEAGDRNHRLRHLGIMRISQYLYITPLALLCGCASIVIFDPDTGGSGDGESGDNRDDESTSSIGATSHGDGTSESTTEGMLDTDMTSSSSGSGSTSGSEGSTTGGEECTGDPSMMEDGWWVSGCCLSPMQQHTCSDWCSSHGYGPCLFIHTTNTGTCEEYGSGINQVGLCDVDVWSTFPTESLDGLGLRCVCDSP